MSRTKVLDLEAQARAIADHWPGYDADFKYWYNPRCMFENPVERVFAGVNPRLEGDSWKNESLAYLNYECVGQIHNEWIDGDWQGDGPKHQDLVQIAFEELYGRAHGVSVLRKTPCFNVLPLRSQSTYDTPLEAWCKAADWFATVLNHLRPRTIICNGNSEDYNDEPGKSPWGAIMREFKVELIRRMPYIAGYPAAGPECLRGEPIVTVKVGQVTEGHLEGSTVIGLPQLTRFGGFRPPAFLESLTVN